MIFRQPPSVCYFMSNEENDRNGFVRVHHETMVNNQMFDGTLLGV